MKRMDWLDFIHCLFYLYVAQYAILRIPPSTEPTMLPSETKLLTPSAIPSPHPSIPSSKDPETLTRPLNTHQFHGITTNSNANDTFTAGVVDQDGNSNDDPDNIPSDNDDNTNSGDNSDDHSSSDESGDDRVQVVLLLFVAVIIAKIACRDDLANPVSISLEKKYSRPSVDLPKYECDNLYDNTKDMVILSQYIYLHAAMVEESQQKPSDGSFWHRNKPSSEIIKNKKAALESVKSVGDIIKLANERTDLFSMKDDGSDVVESAKVIKKDLNENDNIGRTTDSLIEVIQADPEEVSESCVYAITKHDKEKRVVVIFRGTSNAGDWVKDAFITQRSVINPASNESNSLKEKIGLHSGFAKALLSSGNVEQILSEVKKILEENLDYKLFITGHSLGGALATLFGFYVAANDDPIYFTNGPVQIFSASSPRVGNKAFRESFKYLEERGKLRHARVYNARDKVPMLPYLGGFYKHVGLEIKLRPKRVILDYPRYEGWAQSTSVSFMNQLISTFEAVKFHGCQLIRDRLLAAKDELVETTLDLEYKRMWGFSD